MENPDNAALYKDTDKEQKVKRRAVYPDEYADMMQTENNENAKRKEEL